MGEAKRRGGQSERVAAARNKALGNDPFVVAYEALFGMVREVYRQTGGVNHELIGLDFNDGKVSGVNVFVIEDESAKERIPGNIEAMLLKWPIVAHVMEAWESPAEGIAPAEHPERKDIIAITLHSIHAARTASCEVDPQACTVHKADLLPIEKLEGRLGRRFETRH
ncbi:hypothetical protein [Massilia aerilata]|uniref:Uncharacterized protein n=1 Tax=Massilia aerilata TaxID=453817 RepID=A0ABW0S090_9BURK